MTTQEWGDAVEFVATFDEKLANRIPGPHILARGAIIGTVEMTGCVIESPSPWFQGKYGFVFTNPIPMDPVPVKGALGLWNWEKDQAKG